VAVEGNSGADTFNISPTAESLATIQGHLAVTGDADGNTVNIYDQTHSGNDTYTLASSSKVSSSVTRTGAATISYGSDKALNLYGGSGNDTYNIDGTPSGTAVTIKGGSGNDTFNVSPTAKNLGALSGNLTVLGEDGFNTLNIDDQNNSANDTYTLASSSQVSSTISRTGAAKISYASLGAVNLFGGNGKDNYNVNGTPTGTFVGLIGGSGNDTFNMTPTSKNLANIQSGVAVVGETGSNTLNIDDQDNSATVVYSLDSDGVETSVVTRAGAANISYYALGAVNLYGGSGNDTYVVNGTPSGTAVSINGGNGNDDFELNSLRDVTGKINGGGGTNTLDYTDYSGNSPITVNLQSGQAAGTGGFAKIQQLIGSPKVATTLVGANKTNTWSITGTNAGTVNAFAFSGVGYLTGGTGMDVFVFGDGTDLTGVINAGGGDNWLDYAAYSTAVAVNLTLDTATGTLGVVNIENVRGGQGANDLTGDAQGGITQGNILIGGMGANTIMGGTGKSILIGGKGRDSVTGGSGSDVLIAGYAKYDSSTLANDMALESILNEWKSGDSYAMRISKIKSGVGPSSADKLAWGSSVFDNGTANTNTLTGAGGKNGANWFFANMAHTTTNKTANEKLN